MALLALIFWKIDSLLKIEDFEILFCRVGKKQSHAYPWGKPGHYTYFNDRTSTVD